MEAKEPWARPQLKQTICPYRVGFWSYSLYYQGSTHLWLGPHSPWGTSLSPTFRKHTLSTTSWRDLDKIFCYSRNVSEKKRRLLDHLGSGIHFHPVFLLWEFLCELLHTRAKDGILGETSEGLYPREPMADKNVQIILYLAGWNGTCFLLQTLMQIPWRLEMCIKKKKEKRKT